MDGRHMRVIVGVDLGGTNIVVGTVSEDGRRVAGVERRRTPAAQGPDMVVKHIVSAVRESITQAKAVWGSQIEVIGVGIGSPGPIDTKNGIVVTSPNLQWTNMPLRQLVSEIVELPATLENDANCAVSMALRHLYHRKVSSGCRSSWRMGKIPC